MSESSISIGGGSALATRLHDLRLFGKLRLAIGRAATGGLAVGRFIYDNNTYGSTKRFAGNFWKQPASNDDLENVLIKSNEILASATTVFPVTLFPDTIVLDRTKLTVIRRSFIFSEDVMSIRIEDILNVSATMGPFFGSITIATRVLSSDDHFTIKHLWRHDAIHLKHVIQGYVIARHNNIPCDHLSITELMQTLRELGYEANRFHHASEYFTQRDSSRVVSYERGSDYQHPHN